LKKTKKLRLPVGVEQDLEYHHLSQKQDDSVQENVKMNGCQQSGGNNIHPIFMGNLIDPTETSYQKTSKENGKNKYLKKQKVFVEDAKKKKSLLSTTLNHFYSIQNYDLNYQMEKQSAQNVIRSKMKSFGLQFQTMKSCLDSYNGLMKIQIEKNQIITTDHLESLNTNSKNLKRNLDTSQTHRKSEDINQLCEVPYTIGTEEWNQSMKEWAGNLYQDLLEVFPIDLVNKILSNLKDVGLSKEDAETYINSFFNQNDFKSNTFVNEEGMTYERVSDGHINSIGWEQFCNRSIVRNDPSGTDIDIGTRTKKIISIELNGYEDVYDVEVCDIHSFVIGCDLISSNSIKVDNAGITKNLSLFEKEYAATINKTVGLLTEAERRTAHYVGFMKEAALFTGDAAKVTETYSGKLSQLNAITFQMKASLGELFSKGLMPVISALKNQFKAIKDNIEANKELLSVRVSNYFEEFYTYASAATKAVAGFIKVLWELRDLIKAGIGILILNKLLQLLTGAVLKIIEVWKAKVAAITAVRAAQLAANQTFVGATVITEANSVAVAKNITLQRGLAASLITTKVALLGIAAAIVGVVWALQRWATAEERARKRAVESLAVQIDRQRADLELVKSKARVAEAQRKELEELEKSGKLTSDLKIKLDELRDAYKFYWEEIDSREIELLNSEFRKTKTAADEGLNSLKAYFKTIEDAADPTKLTVDQITSLLEVLKKQRDEAAKGPKREIRMRYTPYGTYADQMKPRPTDVGKWAPDDQDIQRLIELENVLVRIKEKKLGLQNILSPDPDKKEPDKKLLKEREKLIKKIEELTKRMNLEILKAYGHEQEAAEKAVLNEIEDRKLLAEQAKALGLDTSLFLIKTEEWKKSQIDEIRRDQLEKDKKAELERLENQKKAAAEAAKLAKQRAEDISEALGRVTLLKAGAREREQLEILERNRELRKKLIEAMEAEKKAAMDLFIVKAATNNLDATSIEKLKERIALINTLKQAIQDISDFEKNEIQKIQKQWIIDSVNVFMQGAQEAASQVGYIWFQNERDTQNEIRRIRQEYSTKRITDETEMLKRIEIAEKNSAIRTANAWKQVFGTMTSTIINSIQSAFMAQANAVKTFTERLQWSLFGGVIGILGSLFTSWNQSRMREEEQFMGMATSLEEQRRTSFGKISQAPIVNLSVVSNVAISGETIFISGGDVSELETGLENLITSTIQKRINTGEIDINRVATG